MTDIVLSTCNRLEYLKRTLEAIFERTKSPYRLHVIDDGSQRANPEYLLDLWRESKIASLTLRTENRGIIANVIAAGGLTASDVVVFTDDDVICPDVEPDWLARGLAAVSDDPDLGILGLNDPSSNINGRRHVIERTGPVTYCKRLGGQFLFVRRRFLVNCPERRLWGAPNSPVKELCHYVQDYGSKVAYLTGTYCWHFGARSARTGQDVGDWLLEPEDLMTLEPPEKYRR